MITLNGKKLARDDNEAINSLFTSATIVGFYRCKGKVVEILDLQRNIVGVINCYKLLCCATRLQDGKLWYTFADVDIIGRNPSFIASREEARTAYDLAFKD